MTVKNRAWMSEYFSEVPKILADYGGKSVAAGYDITSVEGTLQPPDRMAILSFPSVDSITNFLADPRYSRFRQARQQGSDSTLMVFNNRIKSGADLA